MYGFMELFWEKMGNIDCRKFLWRIFHKELLLIFYLLGKGY